MSQIVKHACEELDNAEISCLIVNGEPWFNGAEVATLLGYKKPRGAVYDHIPLKYKNKLSFLVRACKVTETRTLELSELNNAWICEAGLYKLILKSKAKTLRYSKIGFVKKSFLKFARLVHICHTMKL